ncbi:septal ring lytic transglycosylase RlpA family protein [Borreliella americana]|uniref:septal ring lytic transglycosylase RlpA family protein n=1 Tax=Borreliella americana TaxID=478807 RepID=UPI001E2E4CBE|nr:septal ring lytic transglycosylase RlpA family protein [Borreliella americana]MCD2332461.1 septal ring lytic transglycosylase RlpA family protein [Borreliella americana]MCD2349571.1 septal ring lytic transglycosylase RlpA family protein [Borreliella americana]
MRNLIYAILRDKKNLVFLFVFFFIASHLNSATVGLASWYGEAFHGKTTANGEKFDMMALTAAHKELPFNTTVRVTNLLNNRSVVVRINDRGPFRKDRIIDLSKHAAEKLDFLGIGVAPVKIEIIKSVNEKRPSVSKSSDFKKTFNNIPEIKEEKKTNKSDENVSVENKSSNLLADYLVSTDKETDFYIQVGSYKKKDYADRAYQILKKAGLFVVVNSHGPFYTVFIPTNADDVQRNIELIKSAGYKDTLIRKTKVPGESLIMD